MEDNNEKVELLDESDLNAVQEQTQVEPVVQESVQTEPVVPVQTQAPIEPEKKKSNKGIIILLILVVLGALGYFAYQKFKPEEKVVENEKKEVETTYRMSGNGLEAFDLYFMQLENKNKNVVYSPLSIKYALEMLSEGANGDTKTQLDNIIGDYKANKYINNEHMSFANAMFIRNSFKEKIKEAYTTNLKDKYNAEVIYDEFANATNVNNWVKEKTLNLIPKLLDDDSVSKYDFVLLNALGIDMNWNYQIHCATTDSKVPCLNGGVYHLDYNHEKLKGNPNNIDYLEYPYYGEELENISFNNQDNIRGAKVLANFNKYDIIKELGEDHIRKVVGEEYTKWLQSEDYNKDKEYYAEREDEYPKDVNKYLDKYIEEIKANYGKNDQSTDFYAYEDNNVRAFGKDLKEYDGRVLQYIGIMPKEKALNEYLKDMSKDDINDIINNIKEVKAESFKEGVVTIIQGSIPMFKFDYDLELDKDLQELGIKDIYDINKSDLSKMIDEKHIIETRHKATIEFTNDGIKAAAATSAGGLGSTGGPGFDYLFEVPIELIDLTFDKPYLFLIRDKSTGEVWFAGTVYEPTKNNK